MSTLNVGVIAARLGLDSSDFLEKMRGVSGSTAFFSNEMKRQMKDTSREGAEAWRLLDESLGIHISRPLTRIVTKEFPAFASVLQSMLGAGVVGALGVAAFEGFERVSKGIENARKAQEQWATDSFNASETVSGVMGGLREKLAALEGQPARIKFQIEGAEEAKRGIDEIQKALEKEFASAEKANSLTTRFASAAGEFFSHEAEGWAAIADLFGGNAIAEAADTKNLHDSFFDSQGLKNMKAALADMQTDLKIALNDDKDKGTHDAFTLIKNDVLAATAYLRDMQNAGDKAGISLAAGALKFFTDAGTIESLTGKIAGEKTAQKFNTEQVAAAEKLAALYKEIGSSIAKLQPETDPIKKLGAEIEDMRSKAVAGLSAMVPSAQKGIISAFGFDRASASVDRYEKRLDDLKIKLEGDILAKQAFDLFKEPLSGIGRQTPNAGFQLNQPASPVTAGPAPALPTLGEGGRGAAKFDTFASDTAAQYAMASQAVESAMGPQAKYKLAEQELDLLLNKKLIDQNQYNAALADAIDLKSRSAKKGLEGEIDSFNPNGAQMQQLRQRMDALRGMQSSGVGLDGAKLDAGDFAAIKLGMQQIEDEENKILLKTGDIGAGFRAWGTEIQKVASAGELAFQALNEASKGAEDTAINSLMAVMTAQRGEHFKLIHDLEKMWSQYFEGLAKQGMKAGLDQLLAPLGKGLTGAFGAGKQDKAPGLAPTSAGSLTGLGAFLPKPGATGAASLTSAGTILHTAATALLSAATALRASAAGGIGGGAGGEGSSFFGGGAGEAADAGAPIPFFAEGGDATPGSSFISGEAGAERVDLDRSGGAHVMPLGVAAKGGDTNHFYDQRGAVVTDDLVRRAEAASMVHASQRQMMASMPAMQREINLRKRT
jgi:hypothetical protein